MNNIIRYLLKGLRYIAMITIIPAFIMAIFIVMLSSLFQTELFTNIVILSRWIGVTFFSMIFIGICIMIGKMSEMDDAYEVEDE